MHGFQGMLVLGRLLLCVLNRNMRKCGLCSDVFTQLYRSTQKTKIAKLSPITINQLPLEGSLL